MNLREARAALYTMVRTAWTGAGESSDTVFEDNVPNDGSEPDVYVIVSCQPVGGSIVTLGPCEYQQIGLLIAQVFTQAKRGTLRNDQLCDAVSGGFLTAPPGSVRLFNPGIVYVGIDGKYFQQNITVEFEYRRFVSEIN